MTIEIGNKFKLLSHEIKVIIESHPDWSPDGLGRANITTTTIRLNSEMSPDLMLATLLHEIFHFIENFTDIELSENGASTLAVGIASIFMDSPDFIINLIKSLQKSREKS